MRFCIQWSLYRGDAFATLDSVKIQILVFGTVIGIPGYKHIIEINGLSHISDRQILVMIHPSLDVSNDSIGIAGVESTSSMFVATSRSTCETKEASRL
jgi:hypothetical protein